LAAKPDIQLMITSNEKAVEARSSPAFIGKQTGGRAVEPKPSNESLLVIKPKQ
jgi:hypothetical protein